MTFVCYQASPASACHSGAWAWTTPQRQAVKHYYGLTVDSTEKSTLSSILSGC